MTTKFTSYIIWDSFLNFIILYFFIHTRRIIGLFWEWNDISKAPRPVKFTDFYLVSVWYVGNKMKLKA